MDYGRWFLESSMKTLIPHKVYIRVMEKYEGRCQHPRCGKMAIREFNETKETFNGVELSHILSRAKWPEYADKEWNLIPLCGIHHREGKESVHQSAEWEKYYYKFLPDEIICLLKLRKNGNG